MLQYNNINAPITFTYEYKTHNKTYKDQIILNIKGGTSMLVAKSQNKDEKVLETISYTMQEMLQKSL